MTDRAADSSEVERSDRATGGQIAGSVALVVSVLACLVSGILLWARSGFATPPQMFMSGPAGLVALIIATVSQATGGTILTARRPANVVGWIILVFSVAIGLTVLTDGYLALAGTGWSAPIDPALLALIPGAISFPLGTVAAVALGTTFPDGHLVAPRYRSFLVACGIGGVVFSLGVLATPGPLLAFPTIDNPLPVPGDTFWPFVARVIVGPALLVIGTWATAAALIERYRRSNQVGRLQLRWYVAAAVLVTVGFVAYLLALNILPPDSSLGEAIMTAFFLSAALPPIVMVIAITRYRLFDIDTIIGRAVVFGALTAILAGLYAASIRLFNAFFIAVSGEKSELALVITTLILATTFTPIKLRLERVVARRMGPATNPQVAAGKPTDQAATSDASRTGAELFDDPAFLAALDDRIRTTTNAGAPDRPVS